MSTENIHTAPYRNQLLKLIGFSILFVCLSSGVFAQNSKGDKPVKNKRQVTETRAKSVRKKEKGRTRDIANRRLRTKNQSSSNRANVRIPQTSPYSNRSKKTERAATPRGRTFSNSPKESRTKAWKGDVSGYSIRRVKPGKNDAARTNVYPQSGPYVRYARKQPKKRPPAYSRTIKGTSFVVHTPKTKERAWTGGLDRQPIKNQSATGTVKNTFSQKGPYVKYYKKNLRTKDKPVSNRAQISTNKALSRRPLTGTGEIALGPASASRPFVKRGRKNVYWGKFSKKERPFLRDITGGPLRTKNFRTSPGGLSNRDTLQFFGKKPGGDRANRVGGSGYVTTGGRERGWLGDIAGFRLRKSRKGGSEAAGRFFFKRKLSISGTREVGGRKIPGSGYQTRTKKGEQAELNSISAIVYARDLSGKVKHGVKPPKAGGGSIKRQWNNKNQSIAGKGFGGSYRASSYRGNVRQGRGFSAQGIDYAGRIKRNSISGFNTDGVNYSGRLKRNSIRGMSPQGIDYAGKIKRGNVRGMSPQGIDYSGKLKRSNMRGISSQGINYAGRLRLQRANKGGGSISGGLWNNNNQSIASKPPGSVYERNYSGNMKLQRKPKGGGSISGRLFNNNNTPIATKPPGSVYERNYSGNIKFKRPEKGGGSVSGRLFNNNNTPIETKPPGSVLERNYSGNIKFKRPEKGGGSVSGKLWNNNNQPLESPPKGSANINYSGKIVHSTFKKDYIQNPNSAKESLKKKRPDATTYKVAGLQVSVVQKTYKTKPHAAKGSLPGIAPTNSSVKASEYARSMKRYWDYKHNPNSSKEALKLRAPEKAYAKIGSYQGNVKMRRYNDKRLHPDSKFAHGYRDNVKEERTFLMNIKLTWARLFRKSETQPENLKEKISKPKYDKREKGMWND